jgi:HD-like signal output (HDOD) protein
MNTAVDPGFEFVKQLGRELAKGDFDLPPFPDTALRVREAVSDPEVSIEKVSNIVLSEPALTARLLRMANSAMLRRGTMEITDIKTAVSRIGLDMVQNAAVSFAAREAFRAPKGSPLYSQLEQTRKHSIEVAAISYVLASKFRHLVKPDEAMLAGLLHAVGIFYILTRANDFPALFADEAALQDLLSQWHTGVARAIVESWGFPEQIAQAVDEHELLDRDRFLAPEVTDFVIVANIVAAVDAEEITELAALQDLPSLSRMKMDSTALAELLQASEEEIRSMTQAMSG